MPSESWGEIDTSKVDALAEKRSQDDARDSFEEKYPTPVLGSSVRVVGVDPATGESDESTVVTGTVVDGTLKIDGAWSHDPDKPISSWEDLVGRSMTVTITDPDPEVMKIMAGETLASGGLIPSSVPKHDTPPKITINGVQLGPILDGGIVARRDEIGEVVYELKLDDSQLRRLMEQNGIPYVDKNETERIVDAMTPTFVLAEEMKKALADRGWTYEEAERVAADFMREMLVNGVREATK